MPGEECKVCMHPSTLGLLVGLPWPWCFSCAAYSYMPRPFERIGHCRIHVSCVYASCMYSSFDLRMFVVLLTPYIIMHLQNPGGSFHGYSAHFDCGGKPDGVLLHH